MFLAAEEGDHREGEAMCAVCHDEFAEGDGLSVLACGPSRAAFERITTLRITLQPEPCLFKLDMPRSW